MSIDLRIPPKTLVPFVDAYLSYIFSREEYGFSIAENFIRCFVDENEESPWIDYYNAYKYGQYGGFRGFEVSSDFLQFKSFDICDLIEESIENGYAVIYSVDTFYINSYDSYNKEHIVHPLLIYKMDICNNDSYICRDYFDFQFYSESLINKYEIKNSFIESYLNTSNYYDPLLVCFKLEKNNVNALDGNENKRMKDINLEKILYFLKEFIEGTNFMKYDYDFSIYGTNYFATGINIIDTIRNHISINTSEDNGSIKIKHFKFLEHHIFLMKERVKILQQQYRIELSKNLLSQISKVLAEAEYLSNLTIKYNLTENRMLLLKIYQKLDLLKYNYFNFVLKLIKDIELELTKRTKMISIGVDRYMLNKITKDE